MNDIKQLQEERTQLFKDVYDGKQPKRVPIELSVTWDAAIMYAGMNKKSAQWNPNEFYQFFDKICAEFPSDKSPMGPTLRPPVFYEILGAKGIVMSKTGTMQHPEIYCLEVEEYDEFISDPYKCIVEKLMPRMFSALDTKPMRAALNLAKGYKAKCDVDVAMGAVGMQMAEKYGFAVLPKGGMAEAPFDFMADYIRSFTGIIKDMRRNKEQVVAAVEAVLPHMEKIGLVPGSSRYARTFIPLHMAPFMKEKDFAKFWWPTFEKLMQHLSANGAGVKLFVEQDWMKKIDYLASLKDRVEMQFEFGDPQLAK
ncbi:MAG: uroporphyrinogen decarboxylase, partial [Eubacterium sp.]